MTTTKVDWNRIRDLLPPEMPDGILCLLNPRGNSELRLYALDSSQRGSALVGDTALAKAVWELTGKPRGYGVWGRRVLVLLRKAGPTLEHVSELYWTTPYGCWLNMDSGPREWGQTI